MTNVVNSFNHLITIISLVINTNDINQKNTNQTLIYYFKKELKTMIINTIATITKMIRANIWSGIVGISII